MSLSLRPIAHADTARIHEWASRDAACRFQPWGPNTPEQTAAFVDAAVKTWGDRAGTRRVWVALDPTEGVVGLGEIKRVTSTCREIAYAVHIELWGRGFGTQLAELLVEVAFEETIAERVQATCDPRNRGSAAVLRKIGMTLEGTLRHTGRLCDGWRDSQIYSFLRPEARIGSQPG